MTEKDKKTLDQMDILSYIALLLSVLFFLYFVMYRNADRNIEHFQSLIQDVEIELNRIENVEAPPEKKQVKPPGGATEPIMTDPPTFLEKINQQLMASGLELDHVEKSETDNNTYSLVAYAPFDKLLDFLSRVEQSSLAIQDLDIHPYAIDKNLVNMTLQVIQGEMISEEKSPWMEGKETSTKFLRDPFNKDGGIRHTSDKPGIINLTWKYNLTGIGFDRGRYATIDHQNYYQGDFFNGMRVVRIESDRVQLESGSRKYFISFRYGGTSAR